MHEHSRDPIPIAVADDYPDMRSGLRTNLEASGLYRVVLEATHGEEVKQALEGGLQVALVVVDLCMPVMDGYALLEWLRDNRPQVRAVAYTFGMNEAVVLRSYRAGAHGLLQKNARPTELLAALATALGGGIYHTPYSQQVLLDNPDGLTPAERRTARMREQMTARQLHVLEALARIDEPTYEVIAHELGVSRRTVESHVTELFGLFGVRSKTALVLAAVRLGLLVV